MSRARLILGECLEEMRKFEENSIDAIVTDPPYGLSPDGRARTWDEIEQLRKEGKGPRAGFMGNEWDAGVPGVTWARECFRILKPGGHLVAFASTRSIHRLTGAIEDAGFQIRDQLSWIQFQGFPKSVSVSEMVSRVDQAEADKFCGMGTGLKPAFEPACFARKPLEGTIAANALKWGTGFLNIDAARYPFEPDSGWPGPNERPEDIKSNPCFRSRRPVSSEGNQTRNEDSSSTAHDLGRWPANIYATPKPARGERELGCENLKGKAGSEAVKRKEGSAGLENPRAGAGRTAEHVKNFHPTVKPVRLFRWIVRLVGGHRETSVILDPFLGSGTTGVAAMAEGFRFIGIEREPEYFEIAEARVVDSVGPLFSFEVDRSR